jgi:type II secretory pathway component GspD/PulD (secretin)
MAFADSEFDGISGITVKNVSLVEAPLPQVLYVLEELTGKSILRDSSLPNVAIDLQIRKTITRAEAIRAIESALAINHIAIVELGDGLLKAVNAKSASAQSPQFVDDSLANTAPSEKFCSKIFQLKYLPVEEFSEMIKHLLSDDTTSAIVFEDANSVLITDSISNLQRIELILSKVDVPKHSVVESKIFRIKHGDAKNISDLLNNVINGQLAKNAKKGSGTLPGAGSRSVADGDAADAISSFQFSKNITIECDARSNSVVICGTKQDIQRVESIIDQIDVLLDQVRIEVIIAQVSLGKKQGTGLESFGIGYGIGDDPKEIRITDATGTGFEGSNPIFTFSGNLKKFSMNTIFRKARENSNVRILSSPTIVTTHNKEALVKIADSIPIVKSDISDTTSSTTMKSTVEYKDIGIELRVKPLIGINGIVQLEISQRVESKGQSVKLNGNELPSTVKREAVSFVSVRDGDAVVLAGLQEKTVTTNDGKIWLLGDIPVIGRLLFSPKSTVEETKELVIFIKPTIVSNPAEEEEYVKNLIGRSTVGNEIENYNENGKFLPLSKSRELTLADPLAGDAKITKSVKRRGKRTIRMGEKVVDREKEPAAPVPAKAKNDAGNGVAGSRKSGSASGKGESRARFKPRQNEISEVKVRRGSNGQQSVDFIDDGEFDWSEIDESRLVPAGGNGGNSPGKNAMNVSEETI